jgi:hypothetical protein
MIPHYWKEFITKNRLIGTKIEISEDDDLSEIGADLEIMSLEECIEESTEFYPGIVAIKESYIPVASCLEGSGDCYYIKTSEGKGGALYRIYHDEVEDEKLTNEAVDKVLNNYELLLS